MELDTIHALFKEKNFRELYRTQSEIINEMLSLENQEEFDDFLESENFVDENVFLLHYAAFHGESLLVNGYDGDVTEKTAEFLKKRLPNDAYEAISEILRDIYVDIDERDDLKEKTDLCNQRLADTEYFIELCFDDTYYAGIYFLSVKASSDSMEYALKRFEGQDFFGVGTDRENVEFDKY